MTQPCDISLILWLFRKITEFTQKSKRLRFFNEKLISDNQKSGSNPCQYNSAKVIADSGLRSAFENGSSIQSSKTIIS